MDRLNDNIGRATLYSTVRGERDKSIDNPWSPPPRMAARPQGNAQTLSASERAPTHRSIFDVFAPLEEEAAA